MTLMLLIIAGVLLLAGFVVGLVFYLRELDDQPDPRMTAMRKCGNCNYDVHPSIGQCPHCGAPMGKPNADVEQQVRSLLDQGQKIAAVKLYKDQTGVGLAEAKQAVETLAARHGLETHRGGRLGVVAVVVLAAVAFGMTIC